MAGNYMIVAAVVLLAAGAVAVLIRRAGRKGCCGSAGDYRPRRKKLRQVMAVKTFRVEGMHCEKCSSRVTEAVNDIPHAAGAVDLKKGTVTVSYEQEVPDELIRQRIERLGYTVSDAVPGVQ